MVISPPNTFLQFWTDKQLEEWLNELKWRNKNKETRKIYGFLMVPTIEQTKNEIKRRV